MLIFDQLKKNDPQLQTVALAFLVGLGVLAAGLWWVQIVSAGDYQAHLEMQSFRTVRVPAVRGKILDRNGAVLAENRPSYNISLYLEELRKDFDVEYAKELARARADLRQNMDQEQRRLGRKLNTQEKKGFVLSAWQKEILRQHARYAVASNVALRVSQMLRLPTQVSINPTNFEKHYLETLALPFPIVTNLSPVQIALFEEQCTSPMGVDLEPQSTRVYPYHSNAAHLLGCVSRNNESIEGEEAFFSYRLPDYRGSVGLEASFDKELHGKAGVKSVVVNNIGYRQSVNNWQPAEPGADVILTLDLKLQQRVEHALQMFYGPATRGAAVVLDVESGDVLALASSPTLDPNDSLQGLSSEEARRRRDEKLRPEINRATQENYAPGSIFKIITALACLETGTDPKALVNNPGFIYVGPRRIADTAPRDDYDFRLALIHSSNTYFISNGLQAGIENIVKLGQRLQLGHRFGLETRQEARGKFPDFGKIHSQWHDGDTANICIGQGAISVTPLQMAVMTAAIANGGKVLWPRFVLRTEQREIGSIVSTNYFEAGRVRDQLGVKPQNLKIVVDAMRDDVEDRGGTGVKAAVPGLRICGKTGTAQVMNPQNKTIADTVWFASFAPYEKPRYAVLVMVEVEVNAGSGGTVAAPIAGYIYRALFERDRAPAMANAN
jgi:penicillin-binding protein 2